MWPEARLPAVKPLGISAPSNDTNGAQIRPRFTNGALQNGYAENLLLDRKENHLAPARKTAVANAPAKQPEEQHKA
jgi:hypothetical protein